MEKNMKKYIAWTYGSFWCCILIIGAVMMTVKQPVMISVLQIVSAWTPWIVFVSMFRKLYPEEKFSRFMKSKFQEKLHLSAVLWIIAIFGLALAVNVFISVSTDKSTQLLTSPGAFIGAFFYQLIWGPVGEELGWRGYVLDELQKKYSPIKSTTIIWLCWSFWHLPLWVVSGYSGIKLVQYIVYFLVCNFAITLIITAFYNLNHNLLIPVLIHQLFNYVIAIQTDDILHMLMVYSVIYIVIALVIILLNYKRCLYGGKPKESYAIKEI